MRRLLVAVMFVAGGVFVNAQDTVDNFQEVAVGDVLEIGQPDAPKYKHIDFPRTNFIIKRGGIANYKAIPGHKVVVTSMKEKKDGSMEVKIKRADGGRFFGSHTVVAADLEDALQTGELRKI